MQTWHTVNLSDGLVTYFSNCPSDGQTHHQTYMVLLPVAHIASYSSGFLTRDQFNGNYSSEPCKNGWGVSNLLVILTSKANYVPQTQLNLRKGRHGCLRLKWPLPTRRWMRTLRGWRDRFRSREYQGHSFLSERTRRQSFQIEPEDEAPLHTSHSRES